MIKHNFTMKLYLIIILILISIFITYLIYKINKSEKYKSLKRLCNLDKREIENYFKSYTKIFNDQNMISTLEDYNNNKPISGVIIPEKKKDIIRPPESTSGNETCQKYTIKANGKRILKPVKSK